MSWSVYVCLTLAKTKMLEFPGLLNKQNFLALYDINLSWAFPGHGMSVTLNFSRPQWYQVKLTFYFSVSIDLFHFIIAIDNLMQICTYIVFLLIVIFSRNNMFPSHNVRFFMDSALLRSITPCVLIASVAFQLFMAVFIALISLQSHGNSRKVQMKAMLVWQVLCNWLQTLYVGYTHWPEQYIRVW